jgi:NADH:quinone reductase (non-electrogenic)
MNYQMLVIQTSLCHLLGIKLLSFRLQSGRDLSGIGGAVSEAGGLGMLAALSWRDADEIRQMIRETRKLTNHPFG